MPVKKPTSGKRVPRVFPKPQVKQLRPVKPSGASSFKPVLPGSGSALVLSDGYSRLVREHPVIVRGGTTLRSNSIGTPNVESLKAPDGKAMLVDRIVFRLSSDYDYGNSCLLGGVVGCKLSIGNIALTNKSMPIALFAPQGDRGIEADRWDAVYELLLDKPIYLPAGSFIRPEFEHRGLIVSDISVEVLYCGSVVSGVAPRKLYLPWFASFQSAVSFEGSAIAAESTEQDLVNVRDSLLHVERFIGRVFATKISGTAPSTVVMDDLCALPTSTEVTSSIEGLKVQATASNGKKLSYSDVPFYAVFESGRASFEAPHLLKPQEHYLWKVKLPAVTVTSLQSVQPMISMVGWSEVSL